MNPALGIRIVPQPNEVIFVAVGQEDQIDRRQTFPPCGDPQREIDERGLLAAADQDAIGIGILTAVLPQQDCTVIGKCDVGQLGISLRHFGIIITEAEIICCYIFSDPSIEIQSTEH